MFETTRFESERRLPASAVIALGLSAFAAMIVGIAPGVLADVDMEAIADQFPALFVEGFGLQHLGTIEGFVAIELYQFVWLVGFGGYVAYSAAGTIAGDVETDRMDTLLAAPISRRRLLLEKFLALLTPILVVNLVVFGVVYASAALVDEPIAFVDLAAVHALSIPYLLCCGAFGMLASVAAPRRLLAEGVAVGAVVATFLVEILVGTTDVSWLGWVTPMRYYEPLTILTAGTYDLAGAGVLLGATVAFIAGSAWLFGVEDIE